MTEWQSEWERGRLDNEWEGVWKLGGSRPCVASVSSFPVSHCVLVGILPRNMKKCFCKTSLFINGPTTVG